LESANARRSEVPWIVVGGQVNISIFLTIYRHRPIYSSAKGFSEHGIPIGEAKHLQEAMEDLFFEFHVDLVVVGHGTNFL
jgi:hypothetical protein